MSIVISVENISKFYRLGQIGTGTLANDLNVWWAKMRGRPSPFFAIDEIDNNPLENGILWALKDISFRVEQGEVLGIIGRNGAGKSTLLKILSRVTSPTSGKVKIRGRIASLLEVGTGFHPDLTGRENIYLNGAILGMTREEVQRKFDAIVDFSEVENFIDTPVKRYSSGMYVRLAFAVAAHLEPEILIVDEVLAVGDAQFQKKCLGKMGDFAHRGRTVLFVSHNMTAISNLCPQCAWINAGRLEEIDNTQQVLQHYLRSNQQSAGSGTINLQTCTDRYGDGRAQFISAKLLDDNRKISTEFFRTKSLSVELELASFTNQQLNLSLVVVNDLGMNILHFSHFDSSPPIVIEKAGNYRILFTIPSLPLFSGSYQLTLGIHFGAQMIPVDVIKNVLPFTVDEPLDSPRPNKLSADAFLSWAPSRWSCDFLGKTKFQAGEYVSYQEGKQ